MSQGFPHCHGCHCINREPQPNIVFEMPNLKRSLNFKSLERVWVKVSPYRATKWWSWNTAFVEVNICEISKWRTARTIQAHDFNILNTHDPKISQQLLWQDFGICTSNVGAIKCSNWRIMTCMCIWSSHSTMWTSQRNGLGENQAELDVQRKTSRLSLLMPLMAACTTQEIWSPETFLNTGLKISVLSV